MLGTAFPLGYAISRRRATVSIQLLLPPPFMLCLSFPVAMGFGQRSRWPDDQGWPVSSQQSAQRRLLVVDDERVQRVLVARAVESMGFIVDGAADLPGRRRASVATALRRRRSGSVAWGDRGHQPAAGVARRAVRSVVDLSVRPGRTRHHRQPAACLQHGIACRGHVAKAGGARRAASPVAGSARRTGAPFHFAGGARPDLRAADDQGARGGRQERQDRAALSTSGFVARRQRRGRGSAGPLAAPARHAARHRRSSWRWPSSPA